MILLDMSKRSNRWSVYTSDDLFSTKEVILTSYDKITYNVIDDNSWYGAHVKFVCTPLDKNDVTQY